jgi:UDP-N-acetyl-D-glucosamine dehydrogenase
MTIIAPVAPVSKEIDILDKIKTKNAKIGVIGCGYVGLPLAMVFSQAGFRVTGIDLSGDKVKDINRGISYIQDIPTPELAKEVKEGRLKATIDFSAIEELDAIIICVPTPLSKTKDPDLSFIVSASEEIVKYLHNGQVIVLESTTYPGTTEELVLPILEKNGLKVGKDFYLAFSPERVNPGDAVFHTKNTPKVVGGITPRCTEAAKTLYEAAVDKVYPVSSTKVAEMVKLLENTFRSINIGLANEVAQMSHKLGINVWEVIDAAATKPFGFMPFYPGPGLGGHCIPIDPLYLSWKAKQNGFEPMFIELADRVNSSMPQYVVSRITDVLNDYEKSVKGAKILVLGIAYKKNIDDVRESPALDIIAHLTEKGAIVDYHDPYIANIKIKDKSYDSVNISARGAVSNFDCCVIVTDHSNIDYKKIVDEARVIVDTRNALKNFNSPKIIKL